MLRTNFATRPFYNERAVRILIAVFGVLLAAICVFDLQQAVLLSRRLAESRAHAREDEARAAELRRRAEQLRAGIRPAELQQVQAAANEANAIIDRRTFSWTELFNHVETTLPPDVMLTAIRPSIDRGAFVVTMNVVGQGVAEVDGFMQALEETGAFAEVLSTNDQATDAGTLQATIVARYLPSSTPAPETAPAGTPASPAEESRSADAAGGQ